MWEEKICLALSNDFGVTEKEQIETFKKVGFDGFFASFEKGKDLKFLKQIGDAEGMLFQSVHAPFGGMQFMWFDEGMSKHAVNELVECIEKTADIGVSIVVMHAIIGCMDRMPTDLGFKNIDDVVKKAEECGVKLAFENTEGEQFLSAVMERYKGNSTVGFCWDTGHEVCYNHGQDMMALYGDRLLCTHFNDNLGIKDYNGAITYLDDLHLLPFDGVVDWQGVAKRLNRHNYQGELTFELDRKSKPNRYENDVYGKMEFIEYITEAFKRACKVAYLKRNNKDI